MLRPTDIGTGGRHLVHLDMLRGLAAMGVVIGHVRSLVVLGYGVSGTHSIPVQLFYFATSLGHVSVIAFFALSGFLVGGPALIGILDGKWLWSRYLMRRITRLWVVLLPALLLTLGLDTAGKFMGGNAGYAGSFFHLINSGPTSQSPADLSITTFVANVLFLQTITRPVFGSNGPLWSLAYEFWYYIVVPMLLVAILGRSRALSRAVVGVIGMVMAILLPIDLVLLGLIWIAGAIARYALVLSDGKAKEKFWLMFLPLSSLLVIGSMLLDKLWPGIPSDLILGGAFACLLPSLALLPKFGFIYGGIANYLAKISYTLYATHFPVVVFIWFVALAPQKWAIGSTAVILMGSLIATALVVASAMWWLLERNTDRVRSAVEAWLVLGTQRSKKGMLW